MKKITLEEDKPKVLGSRAPTMKRTTETGTITSRKRQEDFMFLLSTFLNPLLWQDWKGKCPSQMKISESFICFVTKQIMLNQ